MEQIVWQPRLCLDCSDFHKKEALKFGLTTENMKKMNDLEIVMLFETISTINNQHLLNPGVPAMP